MGRLLPLAAALLGFASCGDGETPAAPPAEETPAAGRVLVADDRSFERIAVEPDEERKLGLDP
jgi:hypothetical protein